jgi:hypothetical protein
MERNPEDVTQCEFLKKAAGSAALLEKMTTAGEFTVKKVTTRCDPLKMMTTRAALLERMIVAGEP